MSESFKKIGKNNVSRSLLSKVLVPMITEIYEALYRAWWCEPPDGILVERPKNFGSYIYDPKRENK